MKNSSSLDTRCQIPGKYRHYKGEHYQVLGTVYHSETEELLVLYKPLYGEQHLWVRPYEMFNETVIVEGEMVRRFEFVES